LRVQSPPAALADKSLFKEAEFKESEFTVETVSIYSGKESSQAARLQHSYIDPIEGDHRATRSTLDDIVRIHSTGTIVTTHVPDVHCNLVTTRAEDVHCGFGPTRSADVHCDKIETRGTDVHCDNDNCRDGYFDRRSEGDLRVTTVEAATCQCCEKSQTHENQLTVQQVPPRPDAQASNLSPLGKGQELTEGASHWRGEMPQPRLGSPRLRDGKSGGDSRGVENDIIPRGPLVGERQSLTVNCSSNVAMPEQEGQPSHQIPDSVPWFYQIPLPGAPSGDSTVNHPIFAARQRREAPSSDLPRGMDLLRSSRAPEMAGRRIVSDDPGSQRK
jgi:hypothetical protein